MGKRCTKCGELKPLEAFYKAKQYRDGYRYWCKECCRAHTKSHYDREARVAYNRKWNAVNRPKRLAQERRWRERHPDLYKERQYIYTKRWEANNPDKVRAKWDANRARRKGTRGRAVDRQAIFDRDGWICQLCQLPVEKGAESIDHVIPLVLGGKHEEPNLQIAHRSCNSRKGAQTTSSGRTSWVEA